MAIKEIPCSLSVLEAARIRIKNVFDTGLKIYMSVSGGKDSIVMMDIAYKMIEKKEINSEQLILLFIDEEAIFDDVERIAKYWREKYIEIGAKFSWYCIPIKHFNCLNTLGDEETFITWDNSKKGNWVREMPSFAITSHPRLRENIDSYQIFLQRITQDGIQLIGIRTAESSLRRRNIAIINSNRKNEKGINKYNAIFPIYDWADLDVWYYILEEKLDFPETYIYLYQTGTNVFGLRLSQFFSIDTVKSLAKLEEYYPDLMDRIVKREPNAYLVNLYWDSEMFRRNSKKRKELEQEKKTDYRKKVLELLSDIDRNFGTPLLEKNAHRFRWLVIRHSDGMREMYWKKIYDALIAGDPKMRTHRAISAGISWYKAQDIKKEVGADGFTKPHK